MLGATLEIFTKFGLAALSRWGHVLAGVTWIGLLYYFNFVQTPSFAQMDAAARNNAIDKLVPRALWWFRWSAALTVATGVLVLAFQEQYKMDYFKSAEGISIATGILLALTMFANVWLVIWPNQKIVIANARNVQAGGEPDPNAAAAGRRGALASRQNTIFSIPMLLFMVGTSHFFGVNHFDTSSGGHRAIYWIIAVVIWGVFELDALGKIGGFAQNATNKIYETHQNAIITGFVLAVVYYGLWEIILRA